MSPSTLEVWQTEWCPASRRVRQRLTELGLSFTAHQVPVEPEARTDREAATAPPPPKGCCSQRSRADAAVRVTRLGR